MREPIRAEPVVADDKQHQEPEPVLTALSDDKQHQPEAQPLPLPNVPTGERSPDALRRRLPGILTRVADAHIADSKLSPLERAARDWQNAMIRQLGGRSRIFAESANAGHIRVRDLDRALDTRRLSAGSRRI